MGPVTCEFWGANKIDTPEKPKSTFLKFLWWKYEIQPDWMDVYVYDLIKRLQNKGICTRYPKWEETQKTYICGEYSKKRTK